MAIRIDDGALDRLRGHKDRELTLKDICEVFPDAYPLIDRLAQTVVMDVQIRKVVQAMENPTWSATRDTLAELQALRGET